MKNGNTFKSIRSGNFHFLDVCHYLPPGISLDKYVKAFNKNGMKKSIFPYEFLDSYEKLYCNIDVLTKNDFYSSLKNSHITDEEWALFNKNKKELGWKTVMDLLEFYNNLDVKPFLEAVINHREFFYSLNIDMFKDGVSLPSLAEKILFQYEFKDFNDKYIHHPIPKSDFVQFYIKQLH